MRPVRFKQNFDDFTNSRQMPREEWLDDTLDEYSFIPFDDEDSKDDLDVWFDGRDNLGL